VDSTLITGIGAMAVATVGLIMQSRQNEKALDRAQQQNDQALVASRDQNKQALNAARDQNTEALKRADEANAQGRRASAQQRVWDRFHWSLEQAVTASDPKMRGVGWAILSELTGDPSVTVEDRRMMGLVMLSLAQLGVTPPAGSGPGAGGGQQ